jgi:hypothetical protein
MAVCYAGGISTTSLKRGHSAIVSPDKPVRDRRRPRDHVDPNPDQSPDPSSDRDTGLTARYAMILARGAKWDQDAPALPESTRDDRACPALGVDRTYPARA